MTEPEFWTHLEYRVCREFYGLRDSKYRGLGCDGFIAETFEVEAGCACIRGRAWIQRGHDQEAWPFTLQIGRGITSRDEIDWARLLPAEDVTGWLSIDLQRKTLKIDPAAAYPDLPAPPRA